MRGEDSFREAGCKSPPVVGGAGLDIDGTALWSPGNVERPAHVKVLTDMINRVNLTGVGENAGDGIVDDGIVLPAIPKLRDHVEILARPFVSLVVRRMLRQSEILRGLGRTRRDDVPARATL